MQIQYSHCCPGVVPMVWYSVFAISALLLSAVLSIMLQSASQKYDIYTTYVCLTETYKNQTCNKQPYLRCTTVGPSLCKNMIQ